MTERKYLILKAIIESFIEGAEPVSSQYLLQSGDFDVSSATIRNDMAILEEMGLIHQPHTSSGRVPTDLGFRMFIDELMDFPDKMLVRKQEMNIRQIIESQREEQMIHNAVSFISKASNNVGFAILPDGQTYYLGLANFLQKPEFRESAQAYTVVKILEDKYAFTNILKSLPLDDKVRVFVGKENIIPEISSCSLIATRYKLGASGSGIIGILGPIRMNYAFNMALVEEIRDELGV